MANKIIGNTEYKAIRDKAYINGTQENVMQLAAELDKAGINYSGRVSEYRSAITVEAADRAKVLEIMNRILYAAKEKASAESTEKNIIGNTEYRYIANKRYVKGETEIMLRIADRLAAENISFSGRISGDTATVTVSGDETQELVKKYFAEEKNRSENIQSAYFLALSSDTFEDGYYISEVNTTTGEEIAPYRSSIGDIPMFLSVEEALKSAESEGITLSNSAEQLDSWRNIEAEKERQSALARSRELIRQLPETEKGFDEYFVLRENAADWVYFNPDGADGEGQFIVTTLYAEDLLNAYNARSSTADYEKQGQDAFIGIIENGKQTVISADTKEFERYALSCINSRNKENVIVSAPVVSGSGYDENFENIIERLENHFDDVKKHKDRVLSDSYADITDRITDKQNEITAFITNKDFTAAEAVLSELKELLGEAEKIKTEIQSKEITLDDVNDLRSIQPARKSVQNMLENEVAKTPKFEKLLGDEMGDKSAFEMRNSDNEWRNDESKTAVVVNVQKREQNERPIDVQKRKDIPRGTFVNRDTGLEIIFGRRSVEETVANAIYDDKRKLPVEARLAALYQMKDLIENAVCFDSQLSEPSSSKKADNTLFIHRMYGLFTYGNEQYLANLAIEESYSTDRDNKFRDTQNRVYNVNDIKITPVRLLGFQSHAIPQEASTDTSTGVTKITIPQLYEIVKAYDEYFFENPKAAGRLDREAEIEAQQEFSKAMEVLAEKENQLDGEKQAVDILNTEKNLEFTVIAFEDGSEYVEAGKINDDNVKNTSAYADMMKNNFDINNIEDLDESIGVEYAVFYTSDGEPILPTDKELDEIRNSLDDFKEKSELVSSEKSSLYPWKNDDDILYELDMHWRERSDFDNIFEYAAERDMNIVPDKNLSPVAFTADGIRHYNTISAVTQIKLKDSDWLDTVDAAVEMNRRGINFDDVELLRTTLAFDEGNYLQKDITPEQFAFYKKKIDDDPRAYENVILNHRKFKAEKEKDFAQARDDLQNNLAKVLHYSVASDELEDISEKIFTDDTDKKIEIAKEYLDSNFTYGKYTDILIQKSDNDVCFALASGFTKSGFEITYPWSEVAAAFEQAAINEMEWYYTSGEVLEVYKKAIEKDTAVGGALDVQLDRAVFTDWVSDITARQNSVRTAYEANDKALFESTVRREVDNYFYMLCDKDESIEGYNLKDISDFVNAFCRNEFLRKEIYSAVSENVDLSLGVMEKAKEAAHKAGLPFREAVADPEEEFNPYAFDGTMSPEDYELMHKLMREDSVIFKDEDFPLDTTAEQLAGRFTESHEGKFKVEEYFQNNHPTTEELAAFIKDLLENQRQGFGIKDYASDQNGVIFTDLSRYSWEQIAQAVVKAMEKGTYITPEERAAKADVPKYTIYQIKEGEDYRNTRFTNWNDLKRFDIPFDKNNYDFVYSGNVSDVSKSHSNGVVLEEIFKKFNTDHPEDFKGNSLSVSDVIVLEDKNGKSAFFVDSYGMTDVTDLFFDMEKQKIDLSKLSEITLKEEYDRRKDQPDDFLHIKNTITFSNLNSSYLIGRYKEFTYEYDDMPDLDEGDTFTTKQAMLDEVREFLDDMRNDYSKSISITDTDGITTTLEGLLYEFEATEDRLAFMLPDVGYAEMFERDDDSYDYTFYDKNFKVVDSGVYDDVSITIRQAFANVLEDAGFDIEKCEPMDFEKLHDRVKEKAEQSRATDIQTEINELTAEENRAAVDKIEVGAKFPENTQGKIKPIYGKTREEAIEAGEQELYFDDRQENRDCISAIERSISENNDGSHFNGNKAITDLLSEYSVDRIALVIAARVSDAGKWDRRFSRENVEWAEKTLQAFDTEQSAAISRTRFTSHSVLLNDVADELRKNYEMFRSMQTNIEAMEKAKQLINDFCESEYSGSGNFSDLHKVNLAHTTLTDDDLPVQVSADLVDFKMVYEFDGEIFNEEQYDSLDDMIENALSYLDFDELVYVPNDVVERLADRDKSDPQSEKSMLKEGNLVTFADRSGVWKVSAVTDTKIEFENTDPNSPERSLSHIDFGQHRENLQEMLNYTVVSQSILKREESNADKTPNSLTKTNEAAVHNAFQKLKENHDFSPEVLKLLERVEKLIIGNDLENFNSKIFEVPLFQQTYGSVSRVNEKLFGGDLRSVIDEVNGYITDEENAVPDRSDTENKPEQMSLFGGSPKRVSSDEIPHINMEEKRTENSPRTAEKENNDLSGYVISEDDFGEAGGAKSRYTANIEAIKTLKNIEAENRTASSDEQDILSKYTGWGAIPQAFDGNNDKWENEYAELKELLTPEEYAAARKSTMNAHYTSPTVISAIYDGLKNLGFDGGKILEPAMGIGNFFGVCPENIRSNSELYGVELDSITGRIAQQLYPNADVQIKGFEKTNFPDNSFDVALSNVPFGDYKLNDRRYNDNNFLIHDYFFAKALDKVHTGGIVAFVTSKGTLDKENDSVRKYIAQRAELLGAIRLPNNAFKANAGTEVTSDIIFLQKRERPIEIDPDSIEWLKKSETPDGLSVNNYFVQHPEMILGKIVEGNKLYGNQTNETSCIPIEGADLKQQLAEAIKNINGEYRSAEKENPLRNADEIPAPANSRKYSLYAVDGSLYFREAEDTMKKVNVSGDTLSRGVGLVYLRDRVRELLDLQLNNPDGSLDNEIAECRSELNGAYDSFVGKYGNVSDPKNAKAMQGDDGYNIVAALETKDENGQVTGKADIFTHNTVKPKAAVTHVDSAEEALILSVAEKAKVDLEYMTELCGMDRDTLISELDGQIYRLPQKEEKYVTADEYLTGNIRKKLRELEFAPDDMDISKNRKALEEAMPPRVEAKDISVKLGAHWVDTKYIADFIKDKFQPDYKTRDKMEVLYSSVSGIWKIEGVAPTAKNNYMSTQNYGTKRMNAYQILEGILNNSSLQVKDRVQDEYGNDMKDANGKYVLVVNDEETKAVRHCANLIKSEFSDWIFADPDRREALVQKYNEVYNSIRHREYDGSHLNFFGMNTDITLKEHQKNAVARALYGGNCLLAHAVGAGKTYEMIAIAMEGKRLGLHNKCLFAVPNALTEQMGNDFRKLYPNANILVATQKDFDKDNRQRLFGKIAANDWDAVIVGHSQFDRMGLSAEREKEYLTSEINKLRTELEMAAAENNGKGFTVKQIEKSLASYEDKLSKMNDAQKKDDFIDFEQLGFDKVFVDESHTYKNLATATKMHNVSGLGSQGSARAFNLLMKSKYLDELTGSRGLTFASGTPISNSMTELYTLMRYLQSDMLKDLDINHFDEWAADFGEVKTDYEYIS